MKIVFCAGLTGIGLLSIVFAPGASPAGGPRVEVLAGGEGRTGQADGSPAAAIKLIEPFGVAFDRNGNWYICEHKGEQIVRVDSQGRAHRFAGTGSPGHSNDGGPAKEAMLQAPHGIVISRDQKMYVADTLNHRVRLVDLKSGVISTIAGTGEAGFSGDGGPATKAAFNGVFAIDLNRANDRLYVADLFNRRVRVINLRTGIIDTLAGNGEKGEPADGAPAARSPLVDPRAVAVDAKGSVYVLERGGNALRLVDPSGVIRTVIKPGSVTPDLRGPKHLCMDRNGDVLIADAENHLIRRYSPVSGQTTTVAGTAQRGTHVNGADPLRTELNRPHGVAVSPSGDIYISDSYNHRIIVLRK